MSASATDQVVRKTKPGRIPLGLRLFLWAFGAVGVLSWVIGAWSMVQALRCTHWPTTQGTIITAVMQSDNDTTSAEFTYDYQVGGVHYTGTRFAYGPLANSMPAALARYPVGAKVPVHYAPKAPDQAVLETGIHGGSWVILAVGTVFVLVSAGLLRFFSRAAINLN